MPRRARELVTPEWMQPYRGGLLDYAEILATAGVERGLIGPREVPRLWERHILNCAVVAEPSGPISPGARILDIGSGAGLPGLVWALVRPDLAITLAEPLLRRAAFLSESVSLLGVASRVEVRRSRAEDFADEYDVVTARAVAPMERLADWAMPHVRVGGQLLALKGARAEQEIAAADGALREWGATHVAVELVGVGIIDPATTVVRVVRGEPGARGSGNRRTRGRSRQ